MTGCWYFVKRERNGKKNLLNPKSMTWAKFIATRFSSSRDETRLIKWFHSAGEPPISQSSTSIQLRRAPTHPLPGISYGPTGMSLIADQNP